MKQYRKECEQEKEKRGDIKAQIRNAYNFLRILKS